MGDDAYNGELEDVFGPLRELSDLGIQTFLMHGNRDFLLGEQFSAQHNITLIRDDHHLLQIGQSDPLLLMHGDTLCTDDVDYQAMRKTFRDAQWQQEFLSRSIEDRIEFARSLRQRSGAETDKKTDAITDVNQTSVEDTMRTHGITTLLHGHTHRPDNHSFILDSKSAERLVVGDWHPDHAVYAELEDNTVSLKTYR